MKNSLRSLLGIIVFLWMNMAFASLLIPIYLTSSNTPKPIGTVKADDTIYGLLLTPNLKGLPPGLHGFHIHEGTSCGNHGMAAQGHLDPEHTMQHMGPYNGAGHLGDMPALVVNANGTATQQVLAPRLKLDEIKGHTLMIHAGGDNYSDQPQKLGGGGVRIACGVIPFY